MFVCCDSSMYYYHRRRWGRCPALGLTFFVRTIWASAIELIRERSLDYLHLLNMLRFSYISNIIACRCSLLNTWELIVQFELELRGVGTIFGWFKCNIQSSCDLISEEYNCLHLMILIFPDSVTLWTLFVLAQLGMKHDPRVHIWKFHEHCIINLCCKTELRFGCVVVYFMRPWKKETLFYGQRDFPSRVGWLGHFFNVFFSSFGCFYMVYAN